LSLFMRIKRWEKLEKKKKTGSVRLFHKGGKGREREGLQKKRGIPMFLVSVIDDYRSRGVRRGKRLGTRPGDSLSREKKEGEKGGVYHFQQGRKK